MVVCKYPVCQAAQAKQDGEPYGHLAAVSQRMVISRRIGVK